MSQSPKTKGKQLREPPPALFLGPPSQNASHVSLPGVTAAQPNPSSLNGSRAPLSRQRSQRMPGRGNFDGPPDVSVGSALPRAGPPRQQQDAEVKKQADKTDALWAEMQATLEEVELNAVSGTHVFGAEHSKALEELRAAQIELAQAWARSEADGAIESTDKGSKSLGGRGLAFGSEGWSALDAVGSTVPSASGRPGSSGIAAGTAHSMGSKMEEETEADILLSRKRREANDRYFQRVNEGVLEVVAKLEHVASAMKAVERESRDIWRENDSARTSLRE